VSELLDATGTALVTSTILALSTVGMSLQHRVTRHANFAHGEFMTVAAYGMFSAQYVTTNLVVDALVGVAVAVIVALALHWGLLTPFRKRTSRLVIILVVTAAASQLVQAGLALIWGGNYITVAVPHYVAHHVGPFLWTFVDIATLVVGVVLLIATQLLLRYTSFGRAQRAVADDPVLAQIVGISTSTVITRTWILTGILAGSAGAFLTLRVGTFNNLLGFNYLLLIFAAMIVGGIGKVGGAVVGALLIGFITDISSLYVSDGYNQLLALAVLGVIVIVKPTGLFNTSAAETRAFD
jgi:branched-chain amino acid transport system permease protein